ncbi:MAG: glycosyltransferase [Bacteroidetes bacterium]|nr:glycosyltransferase [Bacteroidota bacterium]
MFDPRFTWVWAPFVKFINTRIIVGDIIKYKFKDSYLREGISMNYVERFYKIFYRLEYIPKCLHVRSFNLPLKVYYAGRGGPQKRVGIIFDIIRKCREEKLPVEFKLAGPFRDEVPHQLVHDGTYIGELKGGEEMYNFHKDNDVLLMTSAWEGFPLVIMEAMAFGAVPLVSKIDAIPEHIQHGYKGFLLSQVNSEIDLANEAFENIKNLIANKETLSTISNHAYQYALSNFSAEKFRNEYRKILLENSH